MCTPVVLDAQRKLTGRSNALVCVRSLGAVPGLHSAGRAFRPGGCLPPAAHERQGPGNAGQSASCVFCFLLRRRTIHFGVRFGSFSIWRRCAPSSPQLSVATFLCQPITERSEVVGVRCSLWGKVECLGSTGVFFRRWTLDATSDSL